MFYSEKDLQITRKNIPFIINERTNVSISSCTLPVIPQCSRSVCTNNATGCNVSSNYSAAFAPTQFSKPGTQSVHFDTIAYDCFSVKLISEYLNFQLERF